MSAEARASIIVALILLVAGLGAFLGYRYESNSSRADAAEVRANAAEDAANQATAITSNVLQAVSIINTISQAAKDEKQQNTEQSSDRVAEIKKAVKDDDCAAKPVPSVATDSLRAHRNKIRSGSASAAPGRSDG
ncbi:MAG: DUF2570 domain-containing protein [Enterobacteriaceae bacterium]|nr:DUF2570 domain-containing protein [Enterobacteriaceae bacterium]